jgi:hypothetical protein
MKFIYFTRASASENGPSPVTAKKIVPKWYKDAETWYLDAVDKIKDKGLKTCIPFLDGLTTGYLLLTPVNVYVVNTPSGMRVTFDEGVEYEPVGIRKGETGSTIPRPAGHRQDHLIWKGIWGIKTPKKYSILVTHPFNRFDLPFTTMSAIIDSDKFISSGNIPFFIKNDFEGTIPKGTPFAQIVPIKRNSWTGVVTQGFLKKHDEHGAFVHANTAGYKKFFWQKKDYSIKENKNE